MNNINENLYNFILNWLFVNKTWVAIAIGVAIAVAIAGVYASSLTETAVQEPVESITQEIPESEQEPEKEEVQPTAGRKFEVNVTESFGYVEP